LLKNDVSVAPIHSGLDGGMNEVFHAQFPSIIVPLAIVLPPGSGPELPQLPPVPWTDHDGSLANKYFGAMLGLKPISQTQIVSTGSTTQERGAELRTTGPNATATPKPTPQIETVVAPKL
jgi:hypothetical protein